MLNRTIFLVALLGLVLTVHLWIQKERGFDLGCLGFTAASTQETAIPKCQEVVESDFGSLFGLNNIVLGFFFYVGVATLSFAAVFVPPERKRLLQRIRMASIGMAFAFTLYLMYIQFFEIKTLCILCLTSATMVTILFLLEGSRYIKKQSLVSFNKEPAEIFAEIGLFCVFSFAAAALLVADVFFVNRLGASGVWQEPGDQKVRDLANAVIEKRIDSRFLSATSPCTFDEEKGPIPNFESFISPKDPYLGSLSSPVTVIEIFDPNCPHCKTLHLILKRIAEKYNEKARFYSKAFPLWPYSVPQIEAMWLAAEQGKFFEMIDLQFDSQREKGIPIDDLKRLANSLQLDMQAFDDGLDSHRFRDEVMQFARSVNDAGIQSTPQILINGRLVGSLRLSTAEKCISTLIEESNDKKSLPLEIGLNMTEEEIKHALGEPKKVVNLGSKAIYVYEDIKVTFINSKVVDLK